MTVKVPSSQTGDAYTVIEITVEPQSGPPLLHKHPAHETFYVLQGDFEFWTLRNGRMEIIAGTTGDVIHIPGGVPHNYKNAGTVVGKGLIVFSPGTMEGSFADMSKAQREGPLDYERMQPIAQKYGIEIVPLAAATELL
jgi:quercetin dioxygenase-like cupin family protein